MGYLVDADRVAFRMLESHAPIEILAKPRTFRAFDEHWGADDARVFYDGVALAGAKPNSFRVLDPFYGRDATAVYYRTLLLEEADPESFEAVGFEFARDDRNAYFGSRVISQADPKTLRAINERYCCDANRVFLDGSIVPDLNPDEFGVWEQYRRKGSACYFDEREIPEAEASSFVGLGGDYAKDAVRVYFRGMAFADADPDTFESLGQAIGRDTATTYVGMTPFNEPIIPDWKHEPLEALELRIDCRSGDASAMLKLAKSLIEEGEVFEAYVWSLLAVDHAEKTAAAKRVLRRARQAADPRDEVPEVDADAEREAARRLSAGLEVPGNQEEASKHRARAAKLDGDEANRDVVE